MPALNPIISFVIGIGIGGKKASVICIANLSLQHLSVVIHPLSLGVGDSRVLPPPSLKSTRFETSNSPSCRKEAITIVSIVALIFLMISAVGVHYSMKQMWGYENAVWFVFITMTTIGLGDFVPSWRESFLSPPATFAAHYITPFFAIILTTARVSFTMAIMQNVGNVFSEEQEHLVECEGKSGGSRTMSDSSSASTNSNTNKKIYTSKKNEFFGEKEEGYRK